MKCNRMCNLMVSLDNKYVPPALRGAGNMPVHEYNQGGNNYNREYGHNRNDSRGFDNSGNSGRTSVNSR